MLKFIPNIFRSKDKYADSGMSFGVEIPEKTREELFDKAVNDVVKRELRKILYKEMAELCYSPEQISQTEIASRRTQKGEDINTTAIVFPHAVFAPRGYRLDSGCFGLTFNMDLFLDRLIEGEL